MPLHEIIKPRWVRMLDNEGRFIGNYDPVRGIMMSVKRGGTAFFDLAEVSAEWQRTQSHVDEIRPKRE